MNAKCDSETGGLLKYFKGITLLNGVGFLLLVIGCGGGGAANTTSPPPALPVLSLSSSQDQVRVNTELVLTWSSSNATSCSASGDWSGDKALSGSETVTEAVAGDKTYSLSCSGAGGEQSVSIEVEITPAPDLTVSRTKLQITLVESRTLTIGSDTWVLNFYRNEAYTCGLSGNYTFFVMEPANNPGAEAPLWAYLHGGGYGWFDEDQVYQAVKTQTQDTFNHEETFDDLIDNHLLYNTMSNDEVMDSTLTRRMQEGYRVLLVSMCDHDNYSGRGAPYPNNPNPNGGERQVNGLQATMAAMDYTVANYPSTHVFAHGTSAGSLGVFAMSQAYAEEGTYLTAIVADSWAFTPPRIFDMFDALVGEEGYVFNAGSDLRTDGMDKLGYDYLGLGIYPEAVIEGGFVEVPSMYIVGEKDPGCGGYRGGILSTIPQAAAAGLSNCGWMYDDLRDAIDNQPNSPHVFDLSPTGDHVETNRENPVNNRVDNFVNGVLATIPPHVFP